MAFPLTGTTDVSSAGSRVQIDNTVRRVLSITFRARKGNSGNIYVGDSTVSSSAGFELDSGEALTFEFASAGVSARMSDFYVDTSNSGDDVDWAAVLWP